MCSSSTLNRNNPPPILHLRWPTQPTALCSYCHLAVDAIKGPNQWAKCLWPESTLLKHESWKGLIIHLENKTMQCQWYNRVEEIRVKLHSRMKSIGTQMGTVVEHWARSLLLIDPEHFPRRYISEVKSVIYTATQGEMRKTNRFSTAELKCSYYKAGWSDL